MEKRVDENWKEQVEKEKARLEPGPARPIRAGPTGEFSAFLSTLSMQALLALGEVPHPVTQATQEDLDQARYLIDVLGMLESKTKGNLTAEESSLLEGILYELRMKYVAKTQGAAP